MSLDTMGIDALACMRATRRYMHDGMLGDTRDTERPPSSFPCRAPLSKWHILLRVPTIPLQDATKQKTKTKKRTTTVIEQRLVAQDTLVDTRDSSATPNCERCMRVVPPQGLVAPPHCDSTRLHATHQVIVAEDAAAQNTRACT